VCASRVDPQFGALARQVLDDLPDLGFGQPAVVDIADVAKAVRTFVPAPPVAIFPSDEVRFDNKELRILDHMARDIARDHHFVQLCWSDRNLNSN
jgi:hypothetical protein